MSWQWNIGWLVVASAATVWAAGLCGETSMPVDHVAAELDGRLCEAYFFGRWSTYSHPVTPQDPMCLEQALMRKQFYRAWSCLDGEERRFVLFEALANEHRPIDNTALPVGTEIKGPLFFDLIDAPGGFVMGAPINAAAAMHRRVFGLRFEQGSSGAWSIRQRLTYSYRYHYRPDGRIGKVTITNPEGRVNELSY